MRPSRSLAVLAALTGAASLAVLGGSAQAAPDSGRSFTYAVYGDAPYGTSPTDTSQTEATPGFVAAVNADPLVSGVVHVGDIHSGKQYCTEAYDQQVRDLWSGFADPLVYTPGDNEWTDCHKTKEGGNVFVDGKPVSYANGNPVANLDLVRRTFFATPGRTLGSGTLQVLSQAQVADPAHPEDAAYVENVMWQRKGVLFVTVNIPGGSNNDADPWYGAATASEEQVAEARTRTAADLRWLDRAFDTASTTGAQGVVVVTQADMWDRDGAADAAHVANYEPFLAPIAARTKSLGKPVLMLNGDSHVYRSDNPLRAGAPCTGDEGVCAYDAWQSHPSYDVANFHRVVVHGSTTPLEYLHLTVTPGGHAPASATAFGPFSWDRVTEQP